MKIQTPGTGGLARSIFCHETGLPEKPPLQATRKGGKWRVVHYCSKEPFFVFLNKKPLEEERNNEKRTIE